MASAERQRDYRARRRERMAVDPEYAAKIKAQIREHNRRQYLKQDRESSRQEWNEWHRKKMAEDQEYRERKRAASRRWAANNRDKISAQNRRWAAAHDRSKYNLQWARENAAKRRESTRRRRALLKGATAIEQFTKADVFEFCQGICGICQQPVDPSNWHLDHIVPLSRGGQHTLDNVQVSHPRCNLSKKAKLPAELVEVN